ERRDLPAPGFELGGRHEYRRQGHLLRGLGGKELLPRDRRKRSLGQGSGRQVRGGTRLRDIGMALAMRGPARARERGMSLIEILIALTILALAVLGLMPLFVGSVKTAASASQLSNANALAREKLEELAGYPRDDQRLTVADGKNAAVPTGTTTTGSGSIVAVNAFCNNDLPSWYQPSTGQVSSAA